MYIYWVLFLAGLAAGDDDILITMHRIPSDSNCNLTKLDGRHGQILVDRCDRHVFLCGSVSRLDGTILDKKICQIFFIKMSDVALPSSNDYFLARCSCESHTYCFYRARVAILCL